MDIVPCFKLPVIYDRRASAAEEESFENDLEQQLEDELKLEELMKHRQEPDKTCMVRLQWEEREAYCVF